MCKFNFEMNYWKMQNWMHFPIFLSPIYFFPLSLALILCITSFFSFLTLPPYFPPLSLVLKYIKTLIWYNQSSFSKVRKGYSLTFSDFRNPNTYFLLLKKSYIYSEQGEFLTQRGPKQNGYYPCLALLTFT